MSKNYIDYILLHIQFCDLIKIYLNIWEVLCDIDVSIIANRLDSIKAANPSLQGIQDYHLFTLLFMKYFYYDTCNVAFDKKCNREALLIF